MARDEDRTSARDLGKEEPEAEDERKTPKQAEGDRQASEDQLREQQKRHRA